MAKENAKLTAQVRTVTGKRVKTLRREGLIPSTIYGKGFEPKNIQFLEKEFSKIWEHVGESGLVDIEIDGKKYPVLFRNPQYHPVWSSIMHIDSFKVNLKEKIVATVPLEFIGESDAVKAGNILVEALTEVEVEALPADLPEKITVDISALVGLESQITIADLVIDKAKVELKNDPEQVIVKVTEPKIEEEPEVVETAPIDVPATAQKTEEEKAAAEAEKAKEKEEKK